MDKQGGFPLAAFAAPVEVHGLRNGALDGLVGLVLIKSLSEGVYTVSILISRIGRIYRFGPAISHKPRYTAGEASGMAASVGRRASSVLRRGKVMMPVSSGAELGSFLGQTMMSTNEHQEHQFD